MTAGPRPLPDRRELRHHPCRRIGRAPGRPGHRLQRPGAGLLRPGFSGLRLQSGQRSTLSDVSPLVRGVGLVSQEAAADLQQADLPAVLKEVEQWTDREYASILARGDRLPTPSGGRSRRAGPLHQAGRRRYRGEPPAHRHVPLLPGPAQATGDRRPIRLRATRESSAPLIASPSFDPSLAAVRAPYTSTFNQYIRVELGYMTDVPYYILGEGVGRWDWQRDGLPDHHQCHRDAMAKNPHMKVLIASGYYDLATPTGPSSTPWPAWDWTRSCARNTSDCTIRLGPHDVRARSVATQAQTRRDGINRRGEGEMIRSQQRLDFMKSSLS